MNGTDHSYLRGSHCPEWLEAQNPSLHVSMAVFVTAFLVPYTFKYYVLALRGLICAAFVIFMIWGALFWCTWDVIVWCLVFLIQNLGQLAYTLYCMRRARFPDELEDTFSEMFEPFGVTRHEFKSLVNHNCKWVNIYPGDKYAVENTTTVEARVSLLVAGCLRVTYKGIYLHDVRERQLIDSAEWESTKLRRGEMFQVSIEAIDRCFYLCWNREKLQYYLQANPNLSAAFECIRGRDIMEKVYQTSVNGCRRSQIDAGSAPGKEVNATDIRRGLAVEDPTVIYE